MIVLDSGDAISRLTSMVARIEDFVPVFDAYGEHVLEEIRNRIMHTKVSPDGEPWAPWRPMTADLRSWFGTADRGLLWETGALLADIHEEVDGSFGFDIGTSMPYAEQLQNGVPGKQEARVFLGWSDDDLIVLDKMATKYIMGQGL